MSRAETVIQPIHMGIEQVHTNHTAREKTAIVASALFSLLCRAGL